MSGFCGLPVPSFFMASGARHVLDGYEPPVARALDSGEVYAHLLRPASGGVRDPRLLGSFSPGGLPYGLLSLLGCLTGGVPSLLGRLPDLIGDSAHKTSDAALLLAALLLAAAGEPAYGVLDALDGLSGLTRDLTGGVLSLARYLSDLIGGLSCCLLSLSDCLSGGVLSLLGCSSRGVLYLSNSLSGGILRSLRGRSGGTVLRDFGLLLASPVSHRLGRLHHVADDDTSVGARALDLREVYTQLFCLAPGRVRCLDLSLTPDLVRVQVGDVLLRLVD